MTVRLARSMCATHGVLSWHAVAERFPGALRRRPFACPRFGRTERGVTRARSERIPRPSRIVLAFALLAACATPPQPAQPLGRLGHPLGTWLHLECVRDTNGKAGPHDVLVDRVDGRVCEPPIAMHLDNLAVPSGERILLAGYETGRWIGMPDAVAKAEGLPLTQAAWQFAPVFVVTSVQAPESLALAARDMGLGAR